ncbi:hypothetical protein ODW09_23345 [Escherichia coli]|nr:hypothetical protein [Escherichia coli]
MDTCPTYFNQNAEMSEGVVHLKKSETKKNSSAYSSVFYIQTSSTSNTIETKIHSETSQKEILKNDIIEELWIKSLEEKAILAAELISKGISNADIVGRVISNLKYNKALISDLKVAIEKHKDAMKNIISEENTSAIKGPNINILSLFNALKFYPVISSLPEEAVTHYIDADAHIVGMVIGEKTNKININFLSNGELSFRHVDTTTGRIRISGSAFFGKDENIKDMSKIKKLISFVQ